MVATTNKLADALTSIMKALPSTAEVADAADQLRKVGPSASEFAETAALVAKLEARPRRNSDPA